MVAALKSRLAAGTNTKLLSAALYLKHGKHFGAKMKNIGVKLKIKTQAATTTNKLWPYVLFRKLWLRRGLTEQQNILCKPEEASQPTATISESDRIERSGWRNWRFFLGGFWSLGSLRFLRVSWAAVFYEKVTYAIRESNPGLMNRSTTR